MRASKQSHPRGSASNNSNHTDAKIRALNEVEAALTAALGQIIKQPECSLEDLKKVLESYPQQVNGEVRYLVSGGFATDLYCGAGDTATRGGIELIATHEGMQSPTLLRFKVEEGKLSVKSTTIDLSRPLLINTSRTCTVRDASGGEIEALLVDPAILLVRTASSFNGKAPSKDDFYDALKLIELANKEVKARPDHAWETLVQEAVESLSVGERRWTVNRMLQAITREGVAGPGTSTLLGKIHPKYLT